MAGKGGRIARVMDFFRAGDKDEVRAVALMAAEVLAQRGILVGQPAATPAPAPTRTRKTRKLRALQDGPVAAQQEDATRVGRTDE